MNDQLIQPPLESFCIKGLHGYKDIRIDFSGESTVVVAENGTGKTTVLNALNAFITRRFHRLASISFESIECKFRGAPLPISISKSQLTSKREGSSEVLSSLASMGSVSEAALAEFISNTYVPGNIWQLRENPIVNQVYMNSPYDWDALEEVFSELYQSLDSSLTDVAKSVSEEVKSHMEGIDVIFLPTYRRIERPVLRPSRPRQPPHRRPPLAKAAHHDDMAFGLADVQERLVQLSEDIERRSNIEYRNLSARVLQDMLTRQDNSDNVSASSLPDVNALGLFFSRVDRTAKTSSSLMLHRIQELYDTGHINDTENKFLRYFLSQLSQVIEETRETELVVEQFVAVCNSYLTLSSDEKSLTFDARTLRVVVQNTWSNDPISLDDLSSGEKQIVSLMSHLHLSPRPKLVLIDEPELSLSIDWQRKVLPDIANSPSVVQLLAITHSPFVFENELDEFAAPLKVSRRERGGDAAS
ncbi:AAA family ATPase [Stenotrophomonas acidaminiphila]|uniref:AAA family ATPase n=1 Tax=Stenotrophomonas acidaminiphila TaxID=128780 RepID=UPI0028A8C261|nr:AAA family ATPase [Stenotrophomonas acidaminiphila]